VCARAVLAAARHHDHPSDLKAGGAGKYTAQKLMHQAWTVAVLVAIVTGLLLLRKAGVPFFERNPVRSAWPRGESYAAARPGCAAVGVPVLVHVYFAIASGEARLPARAMTASSPAPIWPGADLAGGPR
jgi:cytochrome b subunit of formate dehydrogenase